MKASSLLQFAGVVRDVTRPGSESAGVGNPHYTVHPVLRTSIAIRQIISGDLWPRNQKKSRQLLGVRVVVVAPAGTLLQ
jgi:hypothetical protein